jgi:hypothetical protein
MPKELIHSTPCPEGDGANPWPTLAVGWSREGEYVQAKVVDVNSADYEAPGNGLAVQLNRHSLNALIRTLRRARDAAYGRDE